MRSLSGMVRLGARRGFDGILKILFSRTAAALDDSVGGAKWRLAGPTYGKVQSAALPASLPTDRW